MLLHERARGSLSPRGDFLDMFIGLAMMTVKLVESVEGVRYGRIHGESHELSDE